MLNFNWPCDCHLSLIFNFVGIILVLRPHVADDRFQVSFENSLFSLFEVDILLDLHDHLGANAVRGNQFKIALVHLRLKLQILG